MPDERAWRRDAARSSVLLSHAVLVGLTPLIPVPILDDMVKAYLDRRMTAAIGRARGVELTKDQIVTITEEPGGSLLKTVAVGVVSFPLKLVFRKLFVVLEIKRASDLASETFHRGYLLDLAVSGGGLLPAGPRTAVEVRAAIDGVLKEITFSPIVGAVHGVFGGSKKLVADAVSGIALALRRRGEKVTEADVAGAVESAAEEKSSTRKLVERLQRALDQVPDEHLADLHKRLEARLAVKLAPRRS